MNHADAIIGLLIGVAAIVLGATATEFYALGPGQRPKPDTKRIPQWVGRPFFIGFGALLIFWSLRGLRGSWHWRDLWADWWLVAFFAAVWALNRVLRVIETRNSENKIQTLSLNSNGEKTSANGS